MLIMRADFFIQDQLSAAVYAAFYQQTSKPSAEIPSKLEFLISKQNGNNSYNNVTSRKVSMLYPYLWIFCKHLN